MKDLSYVGDGAKCRVWQIHFLSPSRIRVTGSSSLHVTGEEAGDGSSEATRSGHRGTAKSSICADGHEAGARGWDALTCRVLAGKVTGGRPGGRLRTPGSALWALQV